MAISGHPRRFRQESFVRPSVAVSSGKFRPAIRGGFVRKVSSGMCSSIKAPKAKEGRRGRSAARTDGSAHDSAGPWAAHRAPPTTARGQSRRWLAPRVYAVGGTGVLPPTVISTRGGRGWGGARGMGGRRATDDDTCGIQPSEVIRGHPRPPEAIRGHPRSSEAIRDNPRQSEAIRGHPR